MPPSPLEVEKTHSFTVYDVCYIAVTDPHFKVTLLGPEQTLAICVSPAVAEQVIRPTEGAYIVTLEGANKKAASEQKAMLKTLRGNQCVISERR